MKKTSLFTFMVLVLAANYDLVFENGRVLDPESNLDAVRNVGIKNGTIAIITLDGHDFR